MANNVMSVIIFREFTPDVIEKCQSILDGIEQRDDQKNFGDFLVNERIVPGTLADVDSGDWSMEHVGSKWSLITEECLQDEPPNFSVVSAWGVPIAGIESILKTCSSEKPCIACVMYLDEGLGFTGSLVFEDGELKEKWHQEWEDLINLVGKRFPEVNGKWDSSDSIWTDPDAEAIFYENVQQLIAEERDAFEHAAIDRLISK